MDSAEDDVGGPTTESVQVPRRRLGMGVVDLNPSFIQKSCTVFSGICHICLYAREPGQMSGRASPHDLCMKRDARPWDRKGYLFQLERWKAR